MKGILRTEWLAGAILLAGLLLTGGCGKNYQSERLFWQAGRMAERLLADPEKAKDTDYRRVAEAYRRILRLYPQWGRAPEVQLTLGRLYYQKKDFVQAEEEFKKVMENYSGNTAAAVEAQTAIAMLYEEQGNWEKALAEYKKVTENYPPHYLRSFQVPIHIADYYQQEKKKEQARRAYQEAIAGFQKIVDENPKTRLAAVSQNSIAATYVAQEEWNEAIKAFQTLIDNYPEDSLAQSAFQDVARLYLEKLNQPDRAIATMEAFIRRYPESTNIKNARVQIGRIYFAKGDLGRAEDEYQKILNDYPKDGELTPTARRALADIHEERKDWEKAKAEYDKIMAEFPESLAAMEVPLIFVNHYLLAGDEENTRSSAAQALKYYRKIASEKRGTEIGEMAQDFISRTYAAQGKWQDVIEVLREKIRDYPKSAQTPSVYFDIADVYRRGLNQPDKAAEAYREFSKNYPDDPRLPEVQYRLARIYVDGKNYAAAEELYQKLLQEKKTDQNFKSRTRFALAELYEQQNQWKRAEKEYEKVAQDSSPDSLSALEAVFRQADHYRKSGDNARAAAAFEEALKKYQKIAGEDPRSIQAEAAMELSSRIYVLQEKWKEAAGMLNSLVKDFPTGSRRSEYMYRLGKIYQEKLNAPEKALPVYRMIVEEYPMYSGSKDVKARIKEMTEGGKRSAPAPAE